MGICAAIYLVLFLINEKKSKEEKKKARNIMALVLCVAIGFISIVFPPENAFLSFDSPEEAYDYWSGEGEVILTVDGVENTLVVAMKSESSYIHNVFPKTEDGWKINKVFNTESGNSYNRNSIYLDYTIEKSTGECFVQIISVNGTLLELSDEYGTEFVTCEALLSGNYKTYYAYIEEFDENYVFTANGEEIAISEMNVFHG